MTERFNMILDENLRSQLLPYMDLLENPIILKVDADDSENGQKINEFTDELASLSDLISKEKTNLNHKPAFSINSILFCEKSIKWRRSRCSSWKSGRLSIS